MVKQVRTYPGVVPSALALLIGISAVQWLPSLPSRWLMGAVAACALIPAWRLPRIRWFAIVLLGFAWAAWRGSIVMESRLPKAWEGQDFEVTGHVVGLAQKKADVTSALFQIEQASLDGQAVPWRGLARISWYEEPMATPEPCSQWRLLLRLRRPRGTVNPGGADSERSALARGITAVGYVRSDSSNARQSTAWWCLDRLRGAIADGIQSRVHDPHDAALMRAFIVGDTRGLEQHDWEVARANGISHLLAISGFHVGVAAVFGAWLCSAIYWLWPALALRCPHAQAQALFALASACAYGALAGMGMPTVRTLNDCRFRAGSMQPKGFRLGACAGAGDDGDSGSESNGGTGSGILVIVRRRGVLDSLHGGERTRTARVLARTHVGTTCDDDRTVAADAVVFR